MKKFLRHIMTGGMPVSEYSTVTVPIRIHEKVMLEVKGHTMDISTVHWLLCLQPVIFGIWFSKEHVNTYAKQHSVYKIIFKDSEKHNKTTADLRLEYFTEIAEGDGILLLLRLSKASVHHIHLIRTRYLFYRHYKKPEQDFQILKSFAAAYSYPRRVRLISFSDNIFPMDLVGDIPDTKRYVFGLRHTNISLPGIMETKKLVVSEVPYHYKDVIYQLGKHHQKRLLDFPVLFDFVESEIFGFPVPDWCNSYKEIRIVKTISLGSHMLLWGEEINEKSLNASMGHLFHIHFLHFLHQKKLGNAYFLV